MCERGTLRWELDLCERDLCEEVDGRAPGEAVRHALGPVGGRNTARSKHWSADTALSSFFVSRFDGDTHADEFPMFSMTYVINRKKKAPPQKEKN